ncbi:MAG: glycosyltransferase family 4 protein [Pleurocapsa sp.]
MKTLQIGMGWFPEQSGGLNRYYHNFIRHLPSVNIKTTGLVAGSPQVAEDTLGQIMAFSASDASLLKRWFEIRKSWQQLRSSTQYDLIVSHFALYTFPILNQIKNFPLVIHFHGPWALESDVENNKAIAFWFKKAIEQLTYNQGTRFIVLSRAFGQILHQEYNIPSEIIDVIPGGVDLNHFNCTLNSQEARIKLGWTQDRPIIFGVRRLAKRMGLENLIAAISQVRQQHPDVLLYIAGKGALAHTLRQQIQELELTQHIKLLGFLPDELLPVAYRAANFSVVPTVSFEGFGLIILESLASGTPVLATPVGGIPEILKPFNSDLLLEDSSIKNLTQGINEALSGQLQLPSTETCQAYVKSNYSWEKITQQIKSTYQKVLENN